jgi:hypothetical protein
MLLFRVNPAGNFSIRKIYNLFGANPERHEIDFHENNGFNQREVNELAAGQ